MQENSHSTRISVFWKNSFQKLATSRFNLKTIKLPLARIKKLMKVEENVKIVAAEVPILFSCVTEMFIEELTLRAWMSTEDGKRKILQASDIGFAAKTSPMYDFLFHIIPSNNYELKGQGDTKQHYMEQYPFQERQP